MTKSSLTLVLHSLLKSWNHVELTEWKLWRQVHVFHHKTKARLSCRLLFVCACYLSSVSSLWWLSREEGTIALPHEGWTGPEEPGRGFTNGAGNVSVLIHYPLYSAHPTFNYTHTYNINIYNNNSHHSIVHVMCINIFLYLMTPSLINRHKKIKQLKEKLVDDQKVHQVQAPILQNLKNATWSGYTMCRSLLKLSLKK